MCAWSQHRYVMSGLSLLLMVAALGLLVALQGWRSRIPPFDLVPHIRDAIAVVREGRVPDRGCLNGFASYNPPGSTWLLLPGALLFNDPRLIEYPGSALLYLGTLVGMFLLAAEHIGRRCAVLAVGLYGLSELGLFVAGSLWPRGHPAFYVWTIYWASRWIRRRKAFYCLAALVTLGAGLYVFLELAPALVVVPTLWLLYRPPLRLWAVVAGVGITLVLWSPYLAFDGQRGFVNLRSQLLQQDVLPAHYAQSWCHPALAGPQGGEGGEITPSQDVPHLPPPSLRTRLRLRATAVLSGLPYNFERVARLPDAILGTPVSIVLLGLASSSLIILSLSPAARAQLRRWWRPWLWLLAAGLMCLSGLVGALLHESIVRRLLSSDGRLALTTIDALRLGQVGLGLGGMACGLPIWARGSALNGPSLPRVHILVLSLLIPWGILLMLAEPNPYPQGGERRFWWLWPLQVIMLGAFVTEILPRVRPPRFVTRSVSLALFGIILANPVVLARVAAWLDTGWVGPEAAEWQAVDAIAEHVRGQGRHDTAIGYQILYDKRPAFEVFMAAFNIIDPHYKVGGDIDLLFEVRHGIVNTNRCAEGISLADEYRIVQRHPIWAQLPAAAFPGDRPWYRLQQFGPYDVYMRP